MKRAVALAALVAPLFGCPYEAPSPRYTLYRPNLVHFELAGEEPFKAADQAASVIDVARQALRRGELFEDYCACVRLETKEP